MRYLNTTTLRQETNSGSNNIIDSDIRVSNWFTPCPDGYKGEWVDDTYTFIQLPIPTQAEIDAEIAANAQAVINGDSLAYLASTDWLIVRQAETGVAVPADVTTARTAARAAIV